MNVQDIGNLNAKIPCRNQRIQTELLDQTLSIIHDVINLHEYWTEHEKSSSQNYCKKVGCSL